MAAFFRTCLDGHRCENGSSCREHPLEEGTFFCDCTTGNGDFAGLFCEYEAETYCQLPEETESTWFCANEGTCVLATSGGNGPSEWRCDCPSDYEGPHCQFIKGNVPRDWPGFDFDPSTGTAITSPSSSGGKDGVEIGIMVAIILVSLTVVALVALLIIRKRKNNMGRKPAAAQNAARDPAEALKLEADGSVLQEVMASMSHTPNSTASGNGTYDETADGNTSVEVEPYSDHPKRDSNGAGIPRTHTNGSYGPSIL